MKKRQQLILKDIVKEFIKTAVPVSSQILVENYNFDLSPATIRNEMQELTEEGYLKQPYTSAGRIPTDKGYRFSVNDFLTKDFSNLKIEKKLSKMIKDLEKETRDLLKFSSQFTKILALKSSSLVLIYLLEKNVLWKEGWQGIFQEPEFKDPDYISEFTKMVNHFEKKIEEFDIWDYPEIKIYIGKENPINSTDEFSLIISRFSLCKEEGILAMLGPKRMPYLKNIGLIRNFVKVLNNQN